MIDDPWARYAPGAPEQQRPPQTGVRDGGMGDPSSSSSAVDDPEELGSFDLDELKRQPEMLPLATRIITCANMIVNQICNAVPPKTCIKNGRQANLQEATRNTLCELTLFRLHWARLGV